MMGAHGDAKRFFMAVVDDVLCADPYPQGRKTVPIPDSAYRNGKRHPLPRQLRKNPPDLYWPGSHNYPEIMMAALHMYRLRRPGDLADPREWLLENLRNQLDIKGRFMNSELLARGYGDWRLSANVALNQHANMNRDLELEALTRRWIQSYVAIMSMAALPYPTEKESKWWKAPFVCTPGQRTPVHKLEGTSLGPMLNVMIDRRPGFRRGARKANHSMFDWLWIILAIKHRYPSADLGMDHHFQLACQRMVNDQIWHEGVLRGFKAKGVCRELHILRTTKGCISWFEGPAAHSEKGVAGCVRGYLDNGKVQADWTRPYTRRGSGASQTKLVSVGGPGERGRVQQDGPTGTESLDLPGGARLWYVVINETGARRVE